MNNKTKTVVAIMSIAILVAGLVVMILDFALNFNLWRFAHPILNFLLVCFVGFGAISLWFAFTKKAPWYFFISGILFALVAFYVVFQYTPWWIALIVAVVDLIIFVVLSLLLCGNKTEEIALNKSPEYKDYKARKEEKASKEAQEEKQELPEIKSFKN